MLTKVVIYLPACSSALELCQKTEIVVISDDTDILVVMIYHFRDDMKDWYFYSETSARSKKSCSVY